MDISFISKHYEKIILAVAVILFFISLIWLINIFDGSSAMHPSSIVIDATKVSYKSVNQKDYDSSIVLKNSNPWLKSEKRNIKPRDPGHIITFTDFMIPFKIARSNAPSSGNKLIPYAYYKAGVCPISNEKISLKRVVVGQAEGLGTDKDGISDAIEKQHNMNPKNPEDIYGDVDNDGFSNIEEFRYNKKGISDKMIHPDLINRVVLLSVSNTKIPLILKKIVKYGDNKKAWHLQVNVKQTGRGWVTKFLKIGDSIKINDMKYTIKDAQQKTTSFLDPRLGTVVDKDISSAILYNSLNEKIAAQKDKWVYEPNRKITLKNLYTNKIIIARENNIITLGDKASGQEKYKIVAITDNGNSIEVERGGKIFVVNKQSNYKPPLKSRRMLSRIQLPESERLYAEKK